MVLGAGCTGSSGAADPAAVLKATPGGVPMGDVSSTLLWVLLQSFFSPMSLKLVGLAVPSLGKGGDNRSQLRGDVPAAWPRVTPLLGWVPNGLFRPCKKWI